MVDSEASTISSNNATNVQSVLRNAIIKDKVSNGEYKVVMKTGRSKVWDVFGKIEDENGEEIENVVACKSCLHVYKFHNNSTSNLVKHKCYISAKTNHESTTSKVEVNTLDKKNGVRILTEWTVKNCRSFKMVEDAGLKQFAEFLISLGAKYGKNVDVDKLLPHPTTVSRNLEKLHNMYFNEVKTEIHSIKEMEFGLSSDMWSDNYLRASYLALTIHYIINGQLVSRLLGMKSMEGERSTSANIKMKVIKLLEEFDLKLDKSIMVTDRGANMVAAFRSNNMFCINHLLHNALEKSMKDVREIDDLCNMCSKLVKYFKKSGINSSLKTTLKSFSPTRWNTLYYLLDSIEKNWMEISNILNEKNELQRICNINLSLISPIVKLLKHFEESSKRLEAENSTTVHLVLVYINKLKKICSYSENDLDIVRDLKEHLKNNLENLVLPNTCIYHKIALYLFPPANKLTHFSNIEKNCIREECKNIMKSYAETPEESETIMSTPLVSAHNAELFVDFVQPILLLNTEDKISNELRQYESCNVALHDDFDLLQWWFLHRTEFPFLYKLSCKILATPASSAASERTFSIGRQLISEKRSLIGSNPTTVNHIMFLHSNMKQKSSIFDNIEITIDEI